MTLTVVIGSSGSGKTTFLTDVHKFHKCTYIRQYHTVRPYVMVSRIPNYDPSSLPFWEIYEQEDKADTIRVGGTMAGENIAGLSGGQRKLLLFDLVIHRLSSQSGLLVCLDEPFAGVTDDFVPFIVQRLQELSQLHNILLVTNDHVEVLTDLADNTISVSAIDRTSVTVNSKSKIDRSMAVEAVSIGNDFQHQTSPEDWKFFFQVEVASNSALVGVGVFVILAYALFVASFWNSSKDNATLVLIAGGIVSYFSINGYLVPLTDWRICMLEETEALLHNSPAMNKLFKFVLTMLLTTIVTAIQFGATNLVIDGVSSSSFFVAMLFDNINLTLPCICLSLFTKMPFATVQTLAPIPMVFLIFFSTTFSPGSGVTGLKSARYFFNRFYFWCMVPGTAEKMEGCPVSEKANLLLMVLTAFAGLALFFAVTLLAALFRSLRTEDRKKQKSEEFVKDVSSLQADLYGEHSSTVVSNV